MKAQSGDNIGGMMRRIAIRNAAIGAGLALIAAATIAAAPRALAPASGGYWQVADSPRGPPRHALCLADPALLSQWEHRGARCTRRILSDAGNKAVIEYNCADGGFGRSEVSVLTPRTIRVATQGISGGAPFNYVLHARRVGNCPPR